MTDNQEAYLEYDRQARRKTFAEKHGAALETRILRFTGQPDEAHLPEIHRLMTNAPRGRATAVIPGRIRGSRSSNTRSRSKLRGGGHVP